MLFQQFGRVRQEGQRLHETLSQNECGWDAAHGSAGRARAQHAMPTVPGLRRQEGEWGIATLHENPREKKLMILIVLARAKCSDTHL